MNIFPPWISLPVLVALYRPLARLLPNLDKDGYVRHVVAASNRYFHSRFVRIPFHKRMLFLPYCLRARHCPTHIDPNEGLVCPDGCKLSCDAKTVKEMALQLGYRAAHIIVSGKRFSDRNVVRSRDFLVRQIRLHRPSGVIGCLCTRDLRQKYLTPQNLSPRGTLGSHGLHVVPQVVLLSNCNCSRNSVDWEEMKGLVRSVVPPQK